MAALMTIPACDLRRRLAPWLPPADAGRAPLGAADIDAVLQGGLLLGAMHELRPQRAADQAAATGFAAALAARQMNGKTNGKTNGKPVLWIQHDFAAIEAGRLYGAIDAFGIPLTSFLLVQVPRTIDVLWAMEEALKCRSVATVVGEIAEDGSAVDLTATRRLSLAARTGGGLGLFLQHRSAADATPSAAATRWEIASVLGERDRFGGLGRTSFALSLVRNRCGPCGRWTMSWDPHEHAFIFPALSRGVAQTARDRSARAQSVRAA
jgi:protein ImuA